MAKMAGAKSLKKVVKEEKNFGQNNYSVQNERGKRNVALAETTPVYWTRPPEEYGKEVYVTMHITKPSWYKFTRINTLEKNSSARPMRC